MMADKLIEAKDENVIKHKEHIQYQAIDLGIMVNGKKVYFADKNIGASSPEDYGDYFMWGSTKPNTKKHCNWEYTPFNNGATAFNKTYFNKHKSKWLTDEGTLKQKYDAAHAIMGDDWRMPTSVEIQELIKGTTQSVDELDGVMGMRFTSNANGNSIFMPFSGRRYGSFVSGVGNYGYAWSSSLNAGSDYYSYGLYFNNYENTNVDDSSRYYGFAVRGVHE